MAERSLRVLIADDEPRARALMRHLLVQLGTEVIGEARDGAEAVELARQLEPEVLVLDISMPNLGGMEAARSLSGLMQKPAIIFCTAHEGFALAAFDVAAVDYLLKPVEEDRLKRALDRVPSFRGQPSVATERVEHMWVPHRSDLLRIEAVAVERVEADRDYVRIHVDGRTHLLRATMEEMERRLDPDVFVRLHRSTIVRRDLIAGLRHEGGGVYSALMPCGTAIRIGRTYLAAARDVSS